MRLYVLACIGVVSLYGSLSSCKSVQRQFLRELPTHVMAVPKGKNGCTDYQGYVPDSLHYDHTPIKYVRLNVHYMHPSHDTLKGLVGDSAIAATKELLNVANRNIRQNRKMLLPPRNTTPNYHPRYQYVLAMRPDDPDTEAVYWHFDDTLSRYVHKGKDTNNWDLEVIKKYGVQLDTVLNVFIMPHHPDSVKSKTYPANGTGIALTNAVKLAGVYEDAQPVWTHRGNLNHEIGHIYGLSHSWTRNDGCDDTPPHPNCWAQTNTPPCDTMASNNVMDYNSFPSAWTPCQIGRIHKNMTTLNSIYRKMLVPTWCEFDPEQTIYIADSIIWHGAKDLEGNLVIEKGGHLTIRCRVSFPKGAKIQVEPGATLRLEDAHLHNDCGDEWQGIEVLTKGKQSGTVESAPATRIENCKHAVRLVSNSPSS